jgi:hypothetical protein
VECRTALRDGHDFSAERFLARLNAKRTTAPGRSEPIARWPKIAQKRTLRLRSSDNLNNSLLGAYACFTNDAGPLRNLGLEISVCFGRRSAGGIHPLPAQ